MEFDISKENVQPLRGGRNPAQLAVALQAQHNQGYQHELEQQKLEFEKCIQTYTGPDPLDNYYHYIIWAEQSYPQHVNYIHSLLEDCISKFEQDPRYVNDERFCKIWIKYIDKQKNPIELYQTLYSKNICVSCSDLYIAWAYYHEAIGDFKNADAVFQMGKKRFAGIRDPYNKLQAAHENMIYAAGQQLINGVDQRRLEDQRQALTMLQPSKSGRVASVRVPHYGSGAGVLPVAGNSGVAHSNVQIGVFQQEDENGIVAGPTGSILEAVKRDAPKENLMKPGTWNCTMKSKPRHNHEGAVAVYVDTDDRPSPHILGIQLTEKFSKETHEDLTLFVPALILFEPDESNRLCVYNKAEVYGEQGKEYSMEEIRARKIKSSIKPPLLSMHSQEEMDTNFIDLDNYMHEQGSNIINQSPSQHHASQMSQHDVSQHNVAQHNNSQPHNPSHHNISQHQIYQNQLPQHQNQMNYSQQQYHQQSQYHVVQNYQQQHHNVSNMNNFHMTQQQQQTPSISPMCQNKFAEMTTVLDNTQTFQNFKNPHMTVRQQDRHCMPFMSPLPHVPPVADNSLTGLFLDSPQSGNETSVVHSIKKPARDKIMPWKDESMYALPQEVRMQPKGSAMKTPVRILNEEDLAETGSRGGLDNAATAQPADSAKRLALYERLSITSDEVGGDVAGYEVDYNDTNTAYFNLNLMHVSTPQNKLHHPNENAYNAFQTPTGGMKKELFPQSSGKKLSAIIEAEEVATHSGSLKSETGTIKKTSMQRYSKNFEENSKVNESLRASLQELLSSDPPSPVVRRTIEEPIEVKVEQYAYLDFQPVSPSNHIDYSVLPRAPSDPFTPKEINHLLHHVGFPGRHRQGYVEITSAPRLTVKKEPCYIGSEGFIIDKQLGKGTFGCVYRATRTVNKQVVALKFQRPPNKWEFYICREIQSRLKFHIMREQFMSIHIGYFCDTASVLVSDFCPYGSLLDAANNLKLKSGHPMKQNLCIYFAIAMLEIVQALHEVKIIHADIKPDNFLIMVTDKSKIGLQLIDMGCSIDMSLYPEGTMFTRKIQTEDFICCEMRDGRPWSYHTDLFCIAASVHVLLFDKYIKISKSGNEWMITQKFSRYHYADMWRTFFHSLLNMQSGLPDINALKSQLNSSYNSRELEAEIREIINVVTGR